MSRRGDARRRPHYFYALRPKRPAFEGGMTPQEAEAMGQHAEHLRRLMLEGKLLLAGPLLDRSLGVGILEAADQADADAMAHADPAHVAGIATVTASPMRLSFYAPRDLAPK